MSKFGKFNNTFRFPQGTKPSLPRQQPAQSPQPVIPPQANQPVPDPPTFPISNVSTNSGDEMPKDDLLVSTTQSNTPKASPQPSQPKPTPPAPAPVSATAVDLPDLGVSIPNQVESGDGKQDLFTGAIQMAFVGAGQGGGRLAQAFYNLGYRKVCVVNTTEQDMVSLTIPSKLIIGNNRGGAGKDPVQGDLAAKESFEDIMDLLMRSWGDGVEMMWVCVGAGGGSGGGSWPTVIEAMDQYRKSTEGGVVERQLGMIVTIPKRSEGSKVQQNALKTLESAFELLNEKKISSLIIIDNAKINDLFPKLSVKKFWDVANTHFASTLHTFNLLAAQNSEYSTFDRADFRTVIRNGIVIFGSTQVESWAQKEDISQSVRNNLKNSLLADGFDLTKANMAGAIVVAHDEILAELPGENIDYAFSALGRALGNDGVCLFNGIYESRQEGMRVFTIVSGLNPPESRLKNLEELAR